ncbi:hypothetical protein BGW38_002302 [Lunasporangiospora selenospora]|uniref:Dynamin-binding protein n=1 Tax=Lunasporangiospora selenospora TaxID=979761 RepID=A0A9P6KDM8_9FUNG|nr:hypothetical protein BGW38_002302 [Lunasporangiospora selenospora]
MGSDEDEPNIDSDRSSTRSPLPSRSPSFNSTGPTPAKNVSKLQQNPVFQQLNTRGVGVTAPPAPARAAPRPDSPPKLPSRSGSTSSVVDSPEEAERKHRLDKRRRVVLELLETEISYSKDMLLLQEVYVTDMQASNQFTAADEKIIFTNLGEVISLTLDFVALLTPACGGGLDQPYDDDGTFVGEAFLQMISRIRRVYSEYCKRQEGSAQYLQELDQRKEFKPFFDACTEKCQGKTTTWDLASILIKPVQRVLKYPLLINQIHALTPPEHADYESLVKVQKDMLQVAEEINDIKKRKDIVEKIVGSKKKNDSDFSRTTQQLRQAVGGSDGTVDILFEALLEKFNMQQRLARDFVKYIQSWLVSIKQYFDTQEAFAISLMEIYGLMPLHRNDENNSIRLVREYHKSLTQFSKTIGRELENRLKRTVYRSIEGFLRLFSGPLQVMKKREKKLLDYDSVRGMRDRGETVDKNMQDSADAYIAINEQLVDELPKFLGLTTQYFDLVVTEFSKIQMFFYAQVRAKANDFYSEFMDPQAAKDLKAYTEQMNVFEDYIEAMRRVDGPVERLERIRILQNVTAMHDTAFRDVRDAEQFQQQRRSRARSSSTPLPPLPARRDQNEEDAYDQKGSLSKSDSQGDLLSSPSGETETDSEQWLPRYYPGEDENPFEMPESIFQDGMSVASDDIFDGRTNVFGQPLSADTSTYSLSSTTEPSLGNGPPALDEGMDMDEIGLAQALFECTAIYPYSSKEERQLSFDAGESIIVFGLNEDGWYFGKKVGKEVTGWFPSSYTIQI